MYKLSTAVLAGLLVAAIAPHALASAGPGDIYISDLDSTNSIKAWIGGNFDPGFAYLTPTPLTQAAGNGNWIHISVDMTPWAVKPASADEIFIRSMQSPPSGPLIDTLYGVVHSGSSIIDLYLGSDDGSGNLPPGVPSGLPIVSPTTLSTIVEDGTFQEMFGYLSGATTGDLNSPNTLNAPKVFLQADVPEPATLALAGLGLFGLLRKRR